MNILKITMPTWVNKSHIKEGAQKYHHINERSHPPARNYKRNEMEFIIKQLKSAFLGIIGAYFIISMLLTPFVIYWYKFDDGLWNNYRTASVILGSIGWIICLAIFAQRLIHYHKSNNQVLGNKR